MFGVNALSEIVEKGIKSLNIPEEPNQLYEPIRYSLASGGKRIRPVLVLASCNVFSESVDSALFPALAIEVFHNFTLIHDDIMDNAAIRRNQPSVYSKWGSNIAILSGDAMNIIAYQLISKTPKHYLKAVFNEFNTIALAVCDGQQLDMNFEKLQYVSKEEYIKMIELKTAALLKGALTIGATLGDASKKDTSSIGEFGRFLGIAFQLQDDLLDVYGNSSSFGKTLGGDIVENKKTYLTVMALSNAKGKTLELLNSYYKVQNIDPAVKIAEVKKIFDEIGVKAMTEEAIKDYFKKSMQFLDAVKVSEERKDVLSCLAKSIMDREK